MKSRADQYTSYLAAVAVLRVLDDLQLRTRQNEQVQPVLRRVFGPAGDYADAVHFSHWDRDIRRWEQ